MDSRSDLSLAQNFIGPWLIGTIVDIYLLGILTVQFSQYWTWYYDDRLSLRLAVVGLQVLTFLKSIQCFTIAWVQCVQHLNNLKDAIQFPGTVWWVTYNALIVALCNLYVQLYFCYRLWIISQRRWWPVATVVAVLSVSSAAIFYGAAGVQSYWSDSRVKDAFYVHIATGLTADIVLSTMTGFFLLRSRNGAEIRNSIVDALFRLTFQAQVPVVLCALLSFILSQLYDGIDESPLSLTFNQILPKLYGVSMMWTLNERRHIRSGGLRDDTDSLTLPNFRTTNSSNIEVVPPTETVKCLGSRRIQEEECTENITVGDPLWTFEQRPAMDEVPTPRSPMSTIEK